MKDKQKFFGILLLVVMILAVGFGIWKVNFAPKPMPAHTPAPEVVDPAPDLQPLPDPEPTPEPIDPNEVPVTELDPEPIPAPEPEPPKEQLPPPDASNSGSNEQSSVPDGYVYVPGFGYLPPPSAEGGGEEESHNYYSDLKPGEGALIGNC